MDTSTNTQILARLDRLENENNDLRRSCRRAKALALVPCLAILVAVTGAWVQGPKVSDELRARKVFCEELYVSIAPEKAIPKDADGLHCDSTKIMPGHIIMSGSEKVSDIPPIPSSCAISILGVEVTRSFERKGRSVTNAARYGASAAFEDDDADQRTLVNSGGIEIGRSFNAKLVAENLMAGKKLCLVDLKVSGLVIRDEEYRDRLKLGAQSTFNKDTEEETRHPAGTITGWSQEGKLLYMLPR